MENNLDIDALLGGPTAPPKAQEAFGGIVPSNDTQADFDKMYQERAAAPKGMTYYDPAIRAPFAAQDRFNPIGFSGTSPHNYSTYALGDTWGETFEKAFQQFGHTFKSSFAESWYGTGRTLRAIGTLGAYGLNANEDDMMRQYYEDQESMMRNAVFLKPGEEDKFFNKKFAADLIGNMGYTFGTIAEMALESALTLGAGYILSAGMKAFKAANTLGKIGDAVIDGQKVLGTAMDAKTGAKTFTTVNNGLSQGDAANNLSRLNKAFNSKAGQAASKTIKDVGQVLGVYGDDIAKSSSIYEKALMIAQNQLPVVGNLINTGRQLSRAGAAGADLMQLGKIGFNGFRRGLAELSMATGESSIESGAAYGDMYTTLVKDFQTKNNRPPTPLEAQKIYETATSTAGAVFDLNMAVLLTSNKLQFGNMFNKFFPANKLMREFVSNEGADAAADIIKRNGKRVAVDSSNLRSLYKGTKEAFGTRAAGWEVMKSVGKSGMKWELAEGVQELIQEGGSHAAKDYYSAMYNEDPMSFGEAFQSGAASQNNMQGAQTFLIGAITGRGVAAVTSVLSPATSSLISRVQGTTEADKKRKEQVKEDINTLNNYFSLPKDAVRENFKTVKEQLRAAEKMTSAATKGDVYKFKNAEADALTSVVRAAMRLNTVDALTDQIKNFGKTFTEEDFKEAFEVDVADTKYKTVSAFTTKVAEDVNKYAKTYQDLSKRFGPIVDPYIFEENSTDFLRSRLLQKTLYDMIDIVALNSIKGNDAVERGKELYAELTQAPEIQNSSDYALRILSDPKAIMSEIGILQKEIASLKKGTLDADGKKLVANKEKEIELLDSWLSKWKLVTEDVVSADGKTRTIEKDRIFYGGNIITEDVVDEDKFSENLNTPEIKKLIKEIINLKNKQAGLTTEVSDTTLETYSPKIIDYVRLGQDSRKYKEALDILMKPEEFRKAHFKLMDGIFKYEINQALGHLTSDVLVEQIAYLTFIKRQQEKANPLDGLNPENQEALVDDLIAIKEEVLQFITNQEEYKKLTAIYLSDYEGFENASYVNDLLVSLNVKVTSLFEDEKPAETPVEEKPAPEVINANPEETPKDGAEKKAAVTPPPAQTERKDARPMILERGPAAYAAYADEPTPLSVEDSDILDAYINDLENNTVDLSSLSPFDYAFYERNLGFMYELLIEFNMLPDGAKTAQQTAEKPQEVKKEEPVVTGPILNQIEGVEPEQNEGDYEYVLNMVKRDLGISTDISTNQMKDMQLGGKYKKLYMHYTNLLKGAKEEHSTVETVKTEPGTNIPSLDVEEVNTDDFSTGSMDVSELPEFQQIEAESAEKEKTEPTKEEYFESEETTIVDNVGAVVIETPSSEIAQSVVKDLNQSVTDADIAAKFFKELSSVDLIVPTPEQIDFLLRNVKAAIKRSKNNSQTVQEYSNTKRGSDNMKKWAKTIHDAALTDVVDESSIEEIKEPSVTPPVYSMSQTEFTAQEVQTLFERFDAYRMNKIQDSVESIEKNRKFVMREADLDSIISDLNDIFSCF